MIGEHERWRRETLERLDAMGLSLANASGPAKPGPDWLNGMTVSQCVRTLSEHEGGILTQHWRALAHLVTLIDHHTAGAGPTDRVEIV